MNRNLPPGCNVPDGIPDPDYEVATEQLLDAIVTVTQHWDPEELTAATSAIEAEYTGMSEADLWAVQKLIARYGRPAVLADALKANPAR